MKKYSIIALCLSIILSLLFIYIYVMDNSKLKLVDSSISNLHEIDNNDNLLIENVNFVEKFIEISGWAIDKGQTYEFFNWVNGKGAGVYNNNTIVLKDSSNKLYCLNTIAQDRKDVTEKINDGIDYRRCGMKAVINISKLKKNESYKIGVIIKDLDGNEKLVMSDKEIKI